MSHKYVYVPFIRKPVIPSSATWEIFCAECEIAHEKQYCVLLSVHIMTDKQNANN